MACPCYLWLVLTLTTWRHSFRQVSPMGSFPSSFPYLWGGGLACFTSLMMCFVFNSFFFFFFCHTCSIWFLGQGLNPSCRPTPQPQQHQTELHLWPTLWLIGSLIHWMRPGIKSTSWRQHRVLNPLSHNGNSLIVFLRYNLRITKFTHFKWTVQWVLVNGYSCTKGNGLWADSQRIRRVWGGKGREGLF